MRNSLTPIALFTFKRPDHTRRTLESLSQNPEFLNSPLFCYCDGARHDGEAPQVEATRKLLRDWPHPNKTLVERDRNLGLAKSVIEGVTQLCSEYGRVIVVEDDLVVSPVFLNYLNTALDRYADEPKVMQISGYMFPIEVLSQTGARLLPITSTWGWATWNRAWKYFGVAEKEISELLSRQSRRRAFDLDGAYPYTRRLRQQINGKSDSWGIQWYLTVFNAGGLVLYPPATLVQNIGHDGSGTHCKIESDEDNTPNKFNGGPIVFPTEITVSVGTYGMVKKYLHDRYGFIPRAWTWFRTELKIRFRY